MKTTMRGETDVDEEETTSDDEAEPEDEGLVAMTMTLHL